MTISFTRGGHSDRIFLLRHLALATLAFALLGAGSPARAATFIGLGDLPGGDTRSSASALSDDGTTVVGSSSSTASGTNSEAYRWRANTGMVGLGDLPGDSFHSAARGVSADGSVVVGSGLVGPPADKQNVVEPGRAFRWVDGIGIQNLGPVGGEYTSASDVSSDGSIVVGTAHSGPAFGAAVRWAPPAPGDAFDFVTGQTSASAVSGDGSTVVGRKRVAGTNDYQAVIFTGFNTTIGLGDLPGGTFVSRASDASHDGSVVVGNGHGVNSTEAFRWTAVTGMVGLGGLPDHPSNGFFSQANAVSSDGSVIVGSASSNARGTEAMIWDAINGMQSITDLLLAQGVDLTGWELTNAVGITGEDLLAEGSGIQLGEDLPTDLWIVTGNGTHNGVAEAWYATLSPGAVPEPATALLLTCGVLAATTRGRTRPAIDRS